jgi:hypothetical protein
MQQLHMTANIKHLHTVDDPGDGKNPPKRVGI